MSTAEHTPKMSDRAILLKRIDWLEQKLRAMRDIDGSDYNPNKQMQGRVEGERGGIYWVLNTLKIGSFEMEYDLNSSIHAICKQNLTEALTAALEEKERADKYRNAHDDLLEALKEVERHHVEQNRAKGRNESRSYTLSIVRAAIAKAEGGAL